MKIKVFIERNNLTREIDVDNINDMFNKLNVDKNTVLITRNNELLTGNEELNNNDEIKLLSVISGG